MSQTNDPFDNESLDALFQGLDDKDSSTKIQRNPFKFLDPYTLIDRDLFFGRDAEIAELYSKFYSSRLLLVYGESGTGKTSLIQCGLQADIPKEEALFIPIRSALGTADALKAELLKLLKKPSKTDDLSQLIEETYEQKSKTLVLVLDQFEEFFLSNPQSKRNEFTQQLAKWLKEKPYLRIIISIREEYYARLTELESQLPELFKNRLWVRRMTREQAREVITKPCETCGIKIETELTDKLLNDLTKDDKEIDLPTLQVVLDSLYNKAKEINPESPTLTLEDYKSLGEISNILASFIENRIASHNNGDAIRQVLKAMITAQGTKKISKLEDIQERLGSFGPEMEAEKLKAVLQQLSDDRIIREDVDNGLYELRHDSLANTIQDWMTGIEKELVQIRQTLDNRFQEYQQRGTLLDNNALNDFEPYFSRLNLSKDKAEYIQKSQHKIRRQKHYLLIRVLGILFVLVLVSYFWFQAEQAKKTALHERKQAIGLISYMNNDLQEKLEPIGQIGLMKNVQEKINGYFINLRIGLNDSETLRQKAIAIQQSANSLRNQEKYIQALKKYDRVQSLLKQILSKSPNNYQWQNDHFKNSVLQARTHSVMGETDKAISVYQNAIEGLQKLIKKAPNRSYLKYTLYETHVRIGDIHTDSYEIVKRIDAYTKALTIQKKLAKESPNKMRLLRDLSVNYRKIGENYKRIGDTQKAKKYYQHSLTTYQKIENIKSAQLRKKQPELIATYSNLAQAHQETGDYSKALVFYEKALILRNNVSKQDPDTASSYDGIGTVYLSTSKYSKALEYFVKSLSIRERIFGKEHLATVTSYNYVGSTYRKMGDYGKALNYLLKALYIRKKVLGKEHPDTAISYNSLGSIYEEMGNYDEALMFQLKALKNYRNILGKEHPTTVQSYVEVGRINYSMGDYAISLDYYLTALRIQTNVLGKDHPATAKLYSNIALVYNAIGIYTKSLEYQLKAISLQEKILSGESLDLATSYNNIGLIYYSMGSYDKALAYYKKTLVIQERNLEKHHQFIIQTQSQIAFTLDALERYSEAYSYAKKSFSSFVMNKDINSLLLDSREKVLYKKHNLSLIEHLLLVSEHYSQQLIKDNKQSQSQFVLKEIVKEWLIYKGADANTENRLFTLARSSSNQNIQNKYQQLLEAKRQYARLSQSASNIKNSPQLNKQLKRILTLEQEIKQSDPRFVIDKLKKISSKDIAKALSEKELYIDYAKTQNGYYLFTIDSNNNIGFIALGEKESQEIDRKISEYLKEINSIIDTKVTGDEVLSHSKKILNRLYVLLIMQPLKGDLIDIKSLTISAVSNLNMLPFDALYDSNHHEYLIEKHTLSYVSSGADFVRLARYKKNNKSDTKKQQIVIFDNPDFGYSIRRRKERNDSYYVQELKPNYAPLPSTKEEADSIQRTMNHYEVQRFSKKSATKDNLLRVQQPSILHIATYGFYFSNQENTMLQSGIILTGANLSIYEKQSYGVVTALDLSGLDLEGTELVVLSTGESGSELTKAFLQAGAKRIISSRWSISDKETVDLMTSFYTNLKKNDNYPLALKEGKLSLIYQGKHPYYWASFELNGL